MRIVSDRQYRLEVDPGSLWEALEQVEHYRAWWPWLHRFEATALADGERWECTVQPPLPYAVRFTLALHDVVPHQAVSAEVSGDIVGQATIAIRPDGDGSSVELRSVLAPANRLLQAVAAVARPVVRLGHDWVLDTGARQLRAALDGR